MGPGHEGARPPAGRERLARLCRLGVARGGVDGAGVSVMARDGAAVPVYSSDERSFLVEDLQFTLGEGPCFDALSSGGPVLVSDLAARDSVATTRWPVFLSEALSAGVRAVFAFPLGVGSVTVGTLDLYRRTPGALGEDQLASTLVTADALGRVLLADPSLQRPAPGDEDQGDVASYRMAVHRAAGMLMVQMDGSIEEALALLRSAAYGQNRSVNELAADILTGRWRYGEGHDRDE